MLASAALFSEPRPGALIPPGTERAGPEGLRGPGVPRVRYELAYEPDPAPGRLTVDVRVEGAEGRALAFELGTFGGWDAAPHEYLTALAAMPALAPRAARDPRFRFVPPASWDGTARLSYAIPLLDAATPAGRSFGLLPCRDGDLVRASACNVLPNVLDGDAPLAGVRTLLVRGPAELFIASGWADPVQGSLAIELEEVDQTPFYFHPAPRVARAGEGDERVLVVQMNAAPDTTQEVLALARTVLDTCADATGVPLGRPERLFLTGADGHVLGGMRTDRGICLNWSPDTGMALFRHVLAHELFHEWLPGKLPAEGEDLIFFFEGFTQYLSLWIAARGGLLGADAFAQRLLELEASARASSAFGRVAFGDPEVAWRDGDGPLELLAYDGGALLAFHLDAALRARGTTLARLLGAWMGSERPDYSLEGLRALFSAAGAEEAYGRFVGEAAVLPSAEAELARLGFFDRKVERRAYVTYLGVESDAGLGPGRVLAVDPQGPQAARDLRAGDLILDYGPRRSAPLRLAPGRASGLGCGLLDLSPSPPDGGWWADVERDGERLRVAIKAWLQEGGLEDVRAADPERTAAFFGVR